MSKLKQALGLKDTESPFPWQEDLLARFRAGIGNRLLLDIPTGLGKTSVMAAWLSAFFGFCPSWIVFSVPQSDFAHSDV